MCKNCHTNDDTIIPRYHTIRRQRRVDGLKTPRHRADAASDGVGRPKFVFTQVGLGDFAPPFLHHDTTYADVVGQYLLFAASSLLGLVLLALLLKALDELLQKRLSKGIDRVAAGVLAMRRRYSSDGSRSRRRRGRRASGGSRDDSRTSSTSA